MTAALIALAVVTLADIVSTIIGLRRGLTEANPIMSALQDRLGNLWWVAKAAATAGLGWWLYSQGAVWPIWALAGALGLIVANNVRLIRR